MNNEYLNISSYMDKVFCDKINKYKDLYQCIEFIKNPSISQSDKYECIKCIRDKVINYECFKY